MFQLTILGSGSAGNCAVLATDQCRLLIDGGLSARQIATRLEQVGVALHELDGILITHEHSDHVSGLEVLCKKHPVPVFCNPLTAEALGRKPGMDWRLFQTGSDFVVKDIAIQTFPVPHDAADPVGFVFHHGEQSLGFLTDLGFATKLVAERIRSVQTLVIETNHDENLLQADTRRPWAIKQRIMSRHGHLSNAAAAAVVGSLLQNGLQRVVLGHLSRDCNTPELAIGTVQSQSAAMGLPTLEIYCASQREISPCFSLG